MEDILQLLEASSGQSRPPILEVWNKIDALRDSEKDAIQRTGEERCDVACVSAIEGAGVQPLLELIDAKVFGSRTRFNIKLPPSESDSYKVRAWIFERGTVESEELDEHSCTILRASLTEDDFSKLIHIFDVQSKISLLREE